MSGRLEEALAERVRDSEVQETARRAVEDELIEWRDEGRSMPFRNNGCVVKYKDGTPTDIIRFGPETAVVVGVDAIKAHLSAAVLALLDTDRPRRPWRCLP